MKAAATSRRRTAKPLSKREIRSAFLIAGALFVAFCAFGPPRTLIMSALLEQDMARHNQTCPMGATVPLDSKKDDEKIIGGTPYSADFLWDGRMDAMVASARYFEGLEALRQSWGSSESWMEGLPSSHGYLLCEIRLRNVNATPCWKDRAGNPRFFISIFGAAPSGELVGFDGTCEDASPEELFYFDLPQGAERTYRVAYDMGAARDVRTDKLALYAASSSATEKYRFALELS